MLLVGEQINSSCTSSVEYRTAADRDPLHLQVFREVVVQYTRS
jgi:hypothetical protein